MYVCAVYICCMCHRENEDLLEQRKRHRAYPEYKTSRDEGQGHAQAQQKEGRLDPVDGERLYIHTCIHTYDI